MSSIPSINQKKFKGTFKDGTPQRLRPSVSVMQHKPKDYTKLQALPSIIAKDAKGVGSERIVRNLSSLHNPANQRKDLFKLITPDVVEMEQNDLMMKKYYGTRLEMKLQQVQLGIVSPNLLKGKMRKKSLQAIDRIKKQVIANQDNQTFASLASDYDEFEPQSRVEPIKKRLDNFKKISTLKEISADDFEEATGMEGVAKRNTLYSTLVKNQTKEASLDFQMEKVKSKFDGYLADKMANLADQGKRKKKKTGPNALGETQNKRSSQALLGALQSKFKEKFKDKSASELYIPKEKRQLKGEIGNKLMEAIKQKRLEQEKAKKIVAFDANKLNVDLKKIQKKQKQSSKKVVEKKVIRRNSFSEGQMKYDDVSKLLNPLRSRRGVSLKDQKVIAKMKKLRRYPIPELMIHVPNDFDFWVDSVIRDAYNSNEEKQWTKYRQDLKVPQNSGESQEEIDFESSSESATDMIPQPINRTQKKEQKKRTEKIEKKSLGIHGFNMDMLKAYPNNAREGVVPVHLLDEKFQGNFKRIEHTLMRDIRQEFEDKKLFPTIGHVQLAYEYYCQQFFCQPNDIKVYVKKEVLQIKNIGLAGNQIKALACTIPIINGINEIKLENNGLMDDMVPVILMAAYMHPGIHTISINQNYLRQTSANTWAKLAQNFPFKIQHINLVAAMQVGDHADSWTDNIEKIEGLQTLNLQGIPIGQAHACRNIGRGLINSTHLKKLNLAGCNISFQGTRYIIDGVMRNQGLQEFIFAQNDMSSSIYEFSIKIAKILTRHQEIMHINLSATGLKKEEVLFIAMAISISSSCISIHLSANQLDYYERIFMRTLVNAKVAYHFRNMAQEVGSIRSQRERAQILELKNHDFDNNELREFMEKWNYIDNQRLGLDEEINEIMKEVDITEIFKQLKKGNKSSLESNNMLQELIKKIEDRIDELAKIKEEDTESDRSDPDKIYNLDDPGTMTKFQTKKLFGDIAKGAIEPEDMVKRDLKEGDDQEDDFWVMQNALKVDRIKKRMQEEAEKQRRAKSAGEMALMFMGINKLAYEQMLENPMTGYMNDIILTRILGSDEIENGHIWRDSSQCYVCEKWDKTQIVLADNDQKVMRQSLRKLDELSVVLKDCVELQNIKLVKRVPESQIQKMYEEDDDRDSNFGEDLLGSQGSQSHKGGTQESFHSISTDTVDKILTESSVSSNERKIYLDDLDHGNTINPIRLDKQSLKKQFQSTEMNEDIQMIKSEGSEDYSEDSGLENYAEEDKKAIREVMKFEQNAGSTPSDLRSAQTGLTPVGNTFGSKVATLGPGINQSQLKISTTPQNKKDSESDSFFDQASEQRDEVDENAFDMTKKSAKMDKTQDKLKMTQSGSIIGGVSGGDSLNNTSSSKEMKWMKDSMRDTMKETVTSSKMKGTVGSSQNTNDKKKVKIEEEKPPEKERKFKIEKRTIFFQGSAFIIEEEVSIDSDNTESVKTSEDDFQVDQNIIANYNERIKERQSEFSDQLQKRIERLQKAMDQNRPLVKLNIFGRAQSYLVASFNNWVPVEMQTLWEIKKKKSEKSDIYDFIQKHRAAGQIMGNPKKKAENLVQYSEFIVPGKHFFYFILQDQFIFLSPKYDVVRFKGTNVLLNMIKVQKRTKELQQVTLSRYVQQAEQIKFLKERSVWKHYQEDTPEFLMKMLEQDLKFGKTSKLTKTKKDADDLKAVLIKHYLDIKNIFLYIASNSSYPTMGLNDFTSFINTSKIMDKNVNLSTVDRQFIATNVSTNPYKQSAERELHRYEFVEVIVRLGISKYKDPKIAPNLHEAAEMILSNDVIPKNKAVDGFNFRDKFMYNLKCDEILKKNEVVIKKLFESFLNPNKKFVTLEEARKLLKKSDMNVSDFRVAPCYTESMMSRIDTMSDMTVLQQMKYVEFLVFICRVAHEIFLGTKQEHLGLHLKIDEVLDPLLDYVGAKKLFSFKKEDAEKSGSSSGDDILDDDPENEGFKEQSSPATASPSPIKISQQGSELPQIPE